MPRISIVTPSYNQGQYLEQTVCSVLSQRYPELEYIIIDGASTDCSIDIIKRHEEHLSYWVSEPDRGQPHALNKGFQRASGEILGYVNSDDVLAPGALARVAEAYRPGEMALYAGPVEDFDSKGTVRVVDQSGLEFRNMLRYWDRKGSWHQPGIFFSRSVYDECGPFDESLPFSFDYDFVCRALQCCKVVHLDGILARFRLHPGSKTGRMNPFQGLETYIASRRYWDEAGVTDRRRAFLHIWIRVVAWSLMLAAKLRLRDAMRLGGYSLPLGISIFTGK